ncbi:MAG: ATP-binding protein, partial [Pseudonocardiaceae bacterium]
MRLGILSIMTTSSPYEMTLSLNVLNHLGINLYSNVPAVISEVVANAYDADAETVRIIVDDTVKSITIIDDGCGMTAKDVNDRFLHVGYQRRSSVNGQAI